MKAMVVHELRAYLQALTPDPVQTAKLTASEDLRQQLQVQCQAAEIAYHARRKAEARLAHAHQTERHAQQAYTHAHDKRIALEARLHAQTRKTQQLQHYYETRLHAIRDHYAMRQAFYQTSLQTADAYTLYRAQLQALRTQLGILKQYYLGFPQADDALSFIQQASVLLDRASQTATMETWVNDALKAVSQHQIDSQQFAQQSPCEKDAHLIAALATIAGYREACHTLPQRLMPATATYIGGGADKQYLPSAALADTDETVEPVALRAVTSRSPGVDTHTAEQLLSAITCAQHVLRDGDKRIEAIDRQIAAHATRPWIPGLNGVLNGLLHRVHRVSPVYARALMRFLMPYAMHQSLRDLLRIKQRYQHQRRHQHQALAVMTHDFQTLLRTLRHATQADCTHITEIQQQHATVHTRIETLTADTAVLQTQMTALQAAIEAQQHAQRTLQTEHDEAQYTAFHRTQQAALEERVQAWVAQQGGEIAVLQAENAFYTATLLYTETVRKLVCAIPQQLETWGYDVVSLSTQLAQADSASACQTLFEAATLAAFLKRTRAHYQAIIVTPEAITARINACLQTELHHASSELTRAYAGDDWAAFQRKKAERVAQYRAQAHAALVDIAAQETQRLFTRYRAGEVLADGTCFARDVARLAAHLQLFQHDVLQGVSATVYASPSHQPAISLAASARQLQARVNATAQLVYGKREALFKQQTGALFNTRLPRIPPAPSSSTSSRVLRFFKQLTPRALLVKRVDNACTESPTQSVSPKRS
ncbi:MAG: hypothetical protein Tsb005_19000 [Gammaproteobacteria bacterium]